jgi:hypothetical protein
MSAALAEDTQQKVENTEFSFQHKLFLLPSVVFKQALDGSGPVMQLDLEAVRATIAASTICDSFGIPAGSPDAKLIDLVSRALKYVKEVRHGDSIPSEILDGRASWLIDPKYAEIANAKLTVQLVAWMQGEQIDLLAAEQALEKANDETTKRKVQDAFSAIAEKLGYAKERRADVIDLVGRLADELSYIEALRDRLLGRIRRLLAVLKTQEANYRRERSVQEEIERTLLLLAKPARKIADMFDELDANVGEILPTLRDYQTRVEYIRKQRDKLREIFLTWEEIIELWNSFEPEPGTALAQAIRHTYRFAARNFPQGSQWSLSIR